VPIELLVSVDFKAVIYWKTMNRVSKFFPVRK